MRDENTCVVWLEGVTMWSQGCPAPFHVDLRFRYEAHRPYDVHLTIRPRQGEQVEWLFGRELLAEGMEGQGGKGDVRIACIRDIVVISLISPSGQAHMKMRAAGVHAFLKETLELVPQGAEHLRVDLDAMINGLIQAES